MKEYKIKINGNNYDVAIKNSKGDIVIVEVNGVPFEVGLDTAVEKKKTPVLVQNVSIPTADRSKLTSSPASTKSVKSPLPGVVLEIAVKEGDQVSVGQKLLVLEAMKMENIIEASHAGKVSAIKVSKGESVLEGAELLIIQ